MMKMAEDKEKAIAKKKREAWKEIKEAQKQMLQSTWLGENYKQNMNLAIEALWDKGARQQDYENYQDYVLRNMYMIDEEDLKTEKQKIEDEMRHEVDLMAEILEDLGF